MNRKYHNWKKWECYKHGFYRVISSKEKIMHKKNVINFFGDKNITKHYMLRIVNEWTYSVEHFLSNNSINRIAWLGQSACCLYSNTPNLITMSFWSTLDESVCIRSNNIAQNIITNWEQKIKLIDMSSNGNKKDIQKEYQMMLPLSLRKED